MKFSKQMTVTLLASFSGVLGNLIAAFIQASLGQITLLQVVFMFAGVVLVAVIVYGIENKKHEHQRQIAELRADLTERRSRLNAMQSKADNGKALTDEEYADWHLHQKDIVIIKGRLREQGLSVADDYLDIAKAPRAPWMVRIVNTFRSMGILSVIFVAFLLSFPLSIGAQAAIVNLWNVPVEPDLVETPTPFLPEPTEEIVPTEELAPTEAPVEEPTEFPAPTEEAFPEPTQEAAPESGTTPTAESVGIGQTTPLAEGTPPPIPAGETPAALGNNGGGGFEFVAADLNQTIVPIGTGTGSLTGRAVWDGQPVEGVKINLTEGVGSGVSIIGIATTASDGTFRFEKLEAKQYGLIVEPPEGYRTADSIIYNVCEDGVSVIRLANPQPIVAEGETRNLGDILLYRTDVVVTDPLSGQTVSDRMPALKWETYPNATYYFVTMLGCVRYYRVTENSLSLYKELDPGSTFWNVYAFNENGLLASSSRNYFTVPGD